MNSSCFIICELNWIVFMAIVKHFHVKMRLASYSDNNGGDRPTQLLSTCFSQLRVWLERVYLLRICPFCMKRSGDLEIFR